MLVILQSSVEPIYIECTRLLKDLYHQVCFKKNLPVDVISYVGDAEETCFDGDTLYIKCDNKLSIDKHRVVYKYIYDHPEYDVIIKTNVSTVLNLELLCKYVMSTDYYTHNFYCAATMWDVRCNGQVTYNSKTYTYSNFPIGFFHMAHYDIWKEIYEAYDDVSTQVMNNLRNQIDNGEVEWSGYPNDSNNSIDINDDLMMGAFLAAIDRRIMELVNYIKIPPLEYDPWPEDRNILDSVFGTACIRCKMAVDSPENYSIREIYEPRMLYLAAKLYEGHITTIQDELEFFQNLRIFTL